MLGGEYMDSTELVRQVTDIARKRGYPIGTNRDGLTQIDFGTKKLHAAHLTAMFPEILKDGVYIPSLIEKVAPGRPCTHKPMREIIAELKTQLSTTEEACKEEQATFPLFGERLLAKINEYPGSTDAQLSQALQKLHQHVNQEARLLESGGKI